MRRVCVLALFLAVGCGGGAGQGADEPSGDFKVEVVSASFPRVQHIAQTVLLRMRVRNADSRALPVAVTVETGAPSGVASSSFGQGSIDAQLADSTRPVWVLDRGPRGGDTAANNTWSAGSLRPGESRLMTWRLVAAKAGAYTVTYRVSPGLTGKARAASPARAAGRFRVVIADQPVPARVGAGGSVIRGGSDGSDTFG
jgi:hypothetical protein